MLSPYDELEQGRERERGKSMVLSLTQRTGRNKVKEVKEQKKRKEKMGNGEMHFGDVV